MAAMAESAKRPLPRLGLLDQMVEEIEGSVLKLRMEGIGQCRDDTADRARRRSQQ
jgi:hypothetical protein